MFDKVLTKFRSMKKKSLITGILMLSLIGIANLYAQVNPYLQTPTPTSVYISWHSSDTLFTKVRYGLSASSLNSIKTGSFQNIDGKKWHTVKLTNLAPGTRYYYRCISGADSSAVYPFRSEPLPGTAGQHDGSEQHAHLAQAKRGRTLRGQSTHDRL